MKKLIDFVVFLFFIVQFKVRKYFFSFYYLHGAIEKMKKMLFVDEKIASLSPPFQNFRRKLSASFFRACNSIKYRRLYAEQLKKILMVFPSPQKLTSLLLSSLLLWTQTAFS